MTKMTPIYDRVNTIILEKLEQGINPWVCGWQRNGQRCSRNYLSEKPYRGINSLLCGLACKESAYFLTFKQIKELGGGLKKGAKSIPIIYFSKAEKKSEQEELDEKEYYWFLKYYNVFSFDDVEGIDSKDSETVVHIDHEPIEAAEKIAEDYREREKLTVRTGGSKAFYRPSEDLVRIPEPGRFYQREEYYSTLFHELAHSTGHETRLNRDMSGLFGDHSYSKEELIAEMTSAYLCGLAGIGSQVIDNQAAYLKSWLSVLKSDNRMIIYAAQAAQKAADLIAGERV